MTASVDVAERRPAATLVIVRSAPALPTLTVEPGLAPAKLCTSPLIDSDAVPTAAAVSDPAPIATAFSFSTFASLPIATPFFTDTLALLPIAVPFSPVTDVEDPIAVPSTALTNESLPRAVAPIACALA